MSRGNLGYPLKDRRLRQLDVMGLNIVDFIHFAPGEFNASQTREFFNIYGRVSARTFSSFEHEVFSGPIRYEMDTFKDVEDFCTANNRDYHILVNEAIPVKDALITGKIMWLDDLRYHIDYFLGRGTTRDVENRGGDLVAVDGVACRHEPLSRDAQTNIALSALVEKTKQVPEFLGTDSVLLEFQIYPYRIGRRKEKLIFWEWLR